LYVHITAAAAFSPKVYCAPAAATVFWWPAPAFLRSKQLPTANLRSKSWDDLGDFSADVVITVCDRAASEACPLWLGRAIKAHWGVPDPTAVKGDEDAIHSAFEKTFALLQSRIDALRALPLREMNAGALQARLDLIGLAHH